MTEKPATCELYCADCDIRMPFGTDENELLELVRVWPHLAALRTARIVDIAIEHVQAGPFLEEHASHQLRIVDQSGETHQLVREGVAEAERLWKAIYFAAGVIDAYETAIRQRPELVNEGFCQSESLRNALTVLRHIASGSPPV